MRARGFSYKEVLLALIVVLVAAAVIVPVTRSLQKKKLAQVDIDRMRNVYLSLALYESEENGTMPPTLATLRDRMVDDETLQALDDPFLSGSEKYPVEPGLPGWQVKAPARISFSFLYSFVTAGKLKVKPWYELKYDPKVGLLADEWRGRIVPGSGFSATVDGPVVRLNTDGAVFVLPRSEAKTIGDSDDLFFRR